LTSVPNNYLTTSTSISQNQINESNGGWISTAIVSTATSAAAGAVLNALYTTSGVLIIATKAELAVTDGRLTSDYYTATQMDFRYLEPLNQNYTLGSSITSGQFTTTIHQNLTIGSSYSNACTCVFYGKVFLDVVVNSDTTLTIGKMNSVYETAYTPLNIDKYTNFNKYVF
jgi:peptidoglycan hydrolase-like protein with peptidoglycan-binding domain